jgi:hypothetical protein
MTGKIISLCYAAIWAIVCVLSAWGVANGVVVWGILGLAGGGWFLWRNLRDVFAPTDGRKTL